MSATVIFAKDGDKSNNEVGPPRSSYSQGNNNGNDDIPYVPFDRGTTSSSAYTQASSEPKSGGRGLVRPRSAMFEDYEDDNNSNNNNRNGDDDDEKKRRNSENTIVNVRQEDEENNNNEEEFDDDDEIMWGYSRQALEYPLLYWLSTKSSKLRSILHNLYRIRWYFAPCCNTQIPTCCNCCRRYCHVTISNLILLLVPTLIILGIGILTNKSTRYSGYCALIPIIISFVSSNQNSILTLLWGISYERGLMLHKLMGVCAILTGIYHAYVAEGQNNHEEHDVHKIFLFDGYQNGSGTVLLYLLIITSITSNCFPMIRSRCYEVYATLLILFSIGCIICLAVHCGILLTFLSTCIFWLLDLLIRNVFVYYKHPTRCTLKHLSSDMIELRFARQTRKRRSLDYNAGQWIKVCIPSVSKVQYHPFYVASSPHMDEVVLQMKVCGDWTNKVYDLAGRRKRRRGGDGERRVRFSRRRDDDNELERNAEDESLTTTTTTTTNTDNRTHKIKIRIEGPYGGCTPSLDLYSNKYKMFLFLSGGIGIIPCQSICEQLMHRKEHHNRILKKIWFVWTPRDPISMSNQSAENNNKSKSRRRRHRQIVPNDIDILSDLGIHHPPAGNTTIPQLPNHHHHHHQNPYRSSTRVMLRESLSSNVLSQLPPPDPVELMGLDMSDESKSRESNDLSEALLDGGYLHHHSGVSGGNSGGEVGGHKYVIQDDQDDETINIELYVTRKQAELATKKSDQVAEEGGGLVVDSSSSSSSDYSVVPFIQETNRPNMDQLFRRMSREAKRLNETNVAVYVCAHSNLVSMVRESCGRYSGKKKKGGGGVRFDLHVETMKF